VLDAALDLDPEHADKAADGCDENEGHLHQPHSKSVSAPRQGARGGCTPQHMRSLRVHSQHLNNGHRTTTTPTTSFTNITATTTTIIIISSSSNDNEDDDDHHHHHHNNNNNNNNNNTTSATTTAL
jgi:hypothetical protein